MTEQEKDYRSLEIQYTDLNRLWMAQGREVSALRAELQALIDAAQGAVTRISRPQLTQCEQDALTRLTNAVVLARATLTGGG